MPASSSQLPSKRDEIVEIASRLFYEQGFGATGIKQIIDEAAIAKGTFYSHFQSKDQLGLAWLQKRHATWNGWFEDALKGKKSARAKLLATFDFLEDWLGGATYRGCAFINTMAEIPDPSNPMRASVAEHKRDLHERFQALACAHFEPLGLAKAAAKEKGTTLFLLFEGALVEAQNFHESWPIQAARKQAKALLES